MTRTPVSHYKLHPDTELEVIDIIRAKMTADEWAMFCWGSAIQYTFRMMDKGEMYKDADKARTYLTWLIEGKP